MKNYLIVGDIAGEYDALLRLVARVPDDTFILALGDLVDRGTGSREVVEWFMRNSHRADSIMGNHEHMMLDFCDDLGVYDHGVWMQNGGRDTLKSYDPENMVYVPSKHLNWLADRKRYYVIPAEGDVPELFASHAALHPKLPIEVAASASGWNDPGFMNGLLWNRDKPGKKDGVFQILGHNSHWGLHKFEDWAICIDSSRQQVLTGMMWPSRELIQEPYVK